MAPSTPHTPEQLFNQALQYHRAGQLYQAEQIYRQLLQQFPQMDIVYGNLGAALVAQNKLHEAVQILERGIVVNPREAGMLSNLGAAYRQLGRSKQALDACRRVVNLAPNSPDAHYNLANIFQDMDRDEEALAAYKKALELQPQMSAAQYNLGNLYHKMQLLAEAAEAYRAALKIEPGHAQASLNLGLALTTLGQAEEALEHFKKATKQHPKDSALVRNLGNSYFLLGRTAEALPHLQKAVELSPKDTEALQLLGNALNVEGREEEASECYKKVLEINPDNRPAIMSLRRLLHKSIPGWHMKMLADQPRNDIYQQAIERNVQSGDTVIDIGTGSGLLALMAARAGASQVHACEMLPTLAQTAKLIVQQNGYTDKVNVINKKSTDLKVGTDLPTKANVLVSEILDAGVIGEGVLPSVRHARQNLLTPDAKVIPHAAQVYGRLISLPYLRRVFPVKNISGFDLSPFDQFRIPHLYTTADLDSYAHQFYSDEFHITDFNLSNPPPAADDERPNVNTLEVTPTESGAVHAVAFWFDLWLDSELKVSTRPGGDMRHWEQAVFFFEEDVEVQKGKALQLQVLIGDMLLGFDVK